MHDVTEGQGLFVTTFRRQYSIATLLTPMLFRQRIGLNIERFVFLARS